ELPTANSSNTKITAIKPARRILITPACYVRAVLAGSNRASIVVSSWGQRQRDLIRTCSASSAQNSVSSGNPKPHFFVGALEMPKYVVEFIGTFFLVLTIGFAVLGNAGPMAPVAIGSAL